MSTGIVYQTVDLGIPSHISPNMTHKKKRVGMQLDGAHKLMFSFQEISDILVCFQIHSLPAPILDTGHNEVKVLPLRTHNVTDISKKHPEEILSYRKSSLKTKVILIMRTTK